MKNIKNKVRYLKKCNGITMVALIVTIIVMLILVGVTVSVNYNGGIFNKAKEAKDNTEIIQEKEILAKATVGTEITKEKLEKRLASYNIEIIEDQEGLIAKFLDTNRYYEIDKKGNIEYIGNKLNKILTVICQKSDGTILDQKEYTILRNKYNITLPELEGYEPIVQQIAGNITEDLTINQVYYQIFDDDETLVFTGINSSGATTTVESEIVSYMVGNNTATSSNGIKDTSTLCILKIPDTYKGKPVTIISKNAFKDVKNIKKIVIGDNVETINNSAFIECNNAEILVLGKAVSTIDSNAFRYHKLEKLVVNSQAPITIKSAETFYPSQLGSNIFCEIEINEGNPTYKVEDGVLYTIDGKTLVLFPIGKTGEFTVPDTVETIASYSFANTMITKVIISDNVTTINNGFERATNLEEVVFGKKVATVGGASFRYCNNLKKITVNSESTFNLNFFSCFQSCGSFTEITVNDGNEMYKVEDNVLYSKDGKTLVLFPAGRTGEFTVPDTVETIKGFSFACGRLTEITIPNSVTSIGNSAFRASSSLKTVIIDSSSIASKITDYQSAGWLVSYANTIYIKENLTSIGSYITANYSEETTDKEGYIKYIKN